MKTVGIIAEFNPFHNGHKYLIEQAKQTTGADNVIIICSGNYVQRGLPAIWDKSIRTKMALLNGADAVFELPFYYSTASAETFARAAVKFLNDLNCVDYLCFGCETKKIELLQVIADILLDEPLDFKNLLAKALKTGISYPKARTIAITEYLNNKNIVIDKIPTAKIPSTNNILESEINSTLSGSALNSDKNLILPDNILSMPNNILAIEYLKALKLFNSNIKPVPIVRIGAGYHSCDTNLEFASATGIRNKLAARDTDDLGFLIPDNTLDFLSLGKYIVAKDFNSLLGTKLIEQNSFSHIYGINDELSNRINNYKYDFTDFDNFIKKIQSKNYTYSAISRALLHIMLDLKEDDVAEFIHKDYFKFGRLLGFKKSSDILSIIKKNSKIDIISKFSTYYNSSDATSKKMLDISINADHIYRMIYMTKYKIFFPTEQERQIVIV